MLRAVVLRPAERCDISFGLQELYTRRRLAYLVKCFVVLEPNVTNHTGRVVRRYLVVTGYVLFVDLYTITDVASYWAMSYDHVLVWRQPT